MKLQS